MGSPYLDRLPATSWSTREGECHRVEFASDQIPVPEGDTVHLAASRLDAAFRDRVITKSDFRVPRYATTDLSGRTILGVTARGKHIMMRISRDLTLHTHFRLEGEWRVYRPDDRWKGPISDVRLIIYSDEWTGVGYRIPIIELLATAREDEIVGHLGPDVLGPDWDGAEALRRLRSDPKRAIGDAIVDQSIMAGPGNVYRCEVCFLRGVHPSTPVGAIDDLEAMVDLVKRLMEANRATGMQVTTGIARRGQGRWVYGRRAEPCRRCGTAIVVDRGGDRVTYFCPHCQPHARGPN
jgi:formamidopyrimidine-DNA glycosylase